MSIKSNSFTISAGRIYGWVLCCVASDFTRAPNKVATEFTSFAIWAKQPFKITCSIHVWNDISRQICTWLCVAALLTVYETGSECRRVCHFFFLLPTLIGDPLVRCNTRQLHVMRRLWHVQSDDLGAGVQIAMLSHRSLPIRQRADWCVSEQKLLVGIKRSSVARWHHGGEGGSWSFRQGNLMWLSKCND